MDGERFVIRAVAADDGPGGGPVVWYFEGTSDSGARGAHSRLWCRSVECAKHYGDGLQARCEADALRAEHRAAFAGERWAFEAVAVPAGPVRYLSRSNEERLTQGLATV